MNAQLDEMPVREMSMRLCFPMEVPAEHLRRAMVCQGVNDVRWYLNGVCLRYDGLICGTNGHRLYVGDAGYRLPSDLILRIHGTITPSMSKDCARAKIHLIDDRLGYIEIVTAKEVKRFFCSVIDGKYPDVRRVIESVAQKKDEPLQSDLVEQISYIGANPKYLGDARKIFAHSKYGCVRIDIQSLTKAYKITDPHDAKLRGEYYVMPARVD